MNSKTITKFYLAIAFIFAVTDCAAQEPLKVITPTELNQAMQKEDIFVSTLNSMESPTSSLHGLRFLSN